VDNGVVQFNHVVLTEYHVTTTSYTRDFP